MFPIFMWIKNYNGLKDLRINLDPNYKIELDFEYKEVNLRREFNKEKERVFYKVIKKINIENFDKNKNEFFYSENIDSINVIVGKNGVGKSSILNLLGVHRKVLFEEKEQKEHLIIYKTKQTGKYVIEGLNLINPNDFFPFIKMDIYLKKDYTIEVFKNKGIIEYLGTLCVENRKSIYGHFKLKQEKNLEIDERSRFERHTQEYGEIKYDYIYDFLKKLDYENYKNKEIKIRINKNKNKREINNVKFEENELCLYSLEGKNLFIKSYLNQSFLFLLDMTFYGVKLKLNKPLNDEKIIKKIIKDLKSQIKSQDIYETIDKLFEKLEEEDVEIRWEKEMLLDIEKSLEGIDFKIGENIELEKLDEVKIKKILSIYDYLNFDTKYSTGAIRQVLDVSIINLSDGEKALINLISSIFAFIEIEAESHKAENIILLIDEIETYLHPEWCRNVINELVKLLNEYKDKEFKLILATHSPFILSDIKKDYCILLEKDTNGKVVLSHPKNETFASNINDLLKDEFFLEKTVGEFAISKIKWVLCVLKEEKISKVKEKEIRDIIDLIGDKIIKKLLLDKLNTKLSIKINKKDELLKIYRSLSDEEKECILGEINDKN